jgi:hypothetical protein
VEENTAIPKHLVSHITDHKSLFTYDDKIDKECQRFPGHITTPNSYYVFSIYEMSLDEKEDKSVFKVAYLTQKQFDQQSHEDMRFTIHEGSNPAYGSCGSKPEPGFEKQSFIINMDQTL